jgi:shikimate kinase
MYSLPYDARYALEQISSLGGGALLDPECRRIAESTGRVVFIECPEDVLLKRIAASQERPLLAGDAATRMRMLLDSRRDHYGSFTERIRVAQ